MKLLNKCDYSKLIDSVRKVPFNNLFARSVIEGIVSGTVYVDNIANINTAYIVHPYGMSLLLGDSNQERFNYSLKLYALNLENKRSSFEWMQTYPEQWHKKLNELFGETLITADKNDSKQEKGIIELNTRVNFRFNRSMYLAEKFQKQNDNIEVISTNKFHYRAMKGTVVPKNFWDNEDDFFKIGKGFSLLYNKTLASMAFCSYRLGNQFEIGIETLSEFRGKGFAEIVCSSLIDYCIENGYEPIWACRKENTGSYKLALKLGFEPVLELPYYRISN